MIKTFTQDDVVRYVYEETSPEENLLIEDALMSEPELMTFFLEALELRALMNKIERQPRASTIQNILNYSKNHPANPTARLRQP
ncbi:hypothetical protein HNV11_00640 [Spirosoma taeanense]|uniref:Uncharacterized protein n=1 Tax=Spirosoma taeanense TaxID=2735870 RepID=A0A6M5Y463_9BACT|nr:hypothetical protein [Spirosoma taeanense]QJW87981.1 hypothetical protein HNV11_00640 [Spirosoma taeanense]